MTELTKEEQMKAISDGVTEAFLILFQFAVVPKQEMEAAIRSGVCDAVVLLNEPP